LKSSSQSNITDPQSTTNIHIHRTDGLGTSQLTENEITRVTTENKIDNTSPQVDKVFNAVDEEYKINHLSCNYPISDSSHSLDDSSEHSPVIHQKWNCTVRYTH
jgi:hypothetical protein